MTHSQVPGWTHLRVHQSVIAERGTWKVLPTSNSRKGVEGRVGSPRIRLGRGISWSSMNLHQNKPPTWLVHILGHLWVLGQAMGTSDHKTHHGPDLGVCHHHIPYSILCDTPPRLHPNGSFSRDSQVGVPKLSRKCHGWSPGTLGGHNSRLPGLIATKSKPNL